MAIHRCSEVDGPSRRPTPFARIFAVATMQSRRKDAAAGSSHNFSGRRGCAVIAARMMRSILLQKIRLTRNCCRDGPDLALCVAGFFRHIKQKLAAPQIDRACPFADTEDRLLAET